MLLLCLTNICILKLQNKWIKLNELTYIKCAAQLKLKSQTHHPPRLGSDIITQLPFHWTVCLTAAFWYRRHFHDNKGMPSKWQMTEQDFLVKEWSVCFCLVRSNPVHVNPKLALIPYTKKMNFVSRVKKMENNETSHLNIKKWPFTTPLRLSALLALNPNTTWWRLWLDFYKSHCTVFHFKCPFSSCTESLATHSELPQPLATFFTQHKKILL